MLECSGHSIVSSSVSQCRIHDGFFIFNRHSFDEFQSLYIADATLRTTIKNDARDDIIIEVSV